MTILLTHVDGRTARPSTIDDAATA